MKHSATIAIVLLLTAAYPAAAIDWMFAPSTYTHDPQTAERVSQYAEVPPVYTYQSPDYRRSGFRYNTSVNRVGQSADRIHIVEEWGGVVRPYGEWQFPYRPYSVPYDAWGPPFGGLSPWGFGGAIGWPAPWLGPYGTPPGFGPGLGHGPGYGPTQDHHAPIDRHGHGSSGHGSPQPRHFEESRRVETDLEPEGERPIRGQSPAGPVRVDIYRDRSADGAYGAIEQGAT